MATLTVDYLVIYPVAFVLTFFMIMVLAVFTRK